MTPHRKYLVTASYEELAEEILTLVLTTGDLITPQGRDRIVNGTLWHTIGRQEWAVPLNLLKEKS